jgi:hypothetical protein
MKRLIGFFTVVLLALFTVTGALAADTVTQGLTKLSADGSSYVWVLDCIDDATDNIAATAMSDAIYSKLRGYYLYQITTDPCAAVCVAPDNGAWDVVLTVLGGTDNLLGTMCNDRSSTLTQKVLAPNMFCLDEMVYFSTTGQTANDAVFAVEFVFVK